MVNIIKYFLIRRWLKKYRVDSKYPLKRRHIHTVAKQLSKVGLGVVKSAGVILLILALSLFPIYLIELLND